MSQPPRRELWMDDDFLETSRSCAEDIVDLYARAKAEALEPAEPATSEIPTEPEITTTSEPAPEAEMIERPSRFERI